MSAKRIALVREAATASLLPAIASSSYNVRSLTQAARELARLQLKARRLRRDLKATTAEIRGARRMLKAMASGRDNSNKQ